MVLQTTILFGNGQYVFPVLMGILVLVGAAIGLFAAFRSTKSSNPAPLSNLPTSSSNPPQTPPASQTATPKVESKQPFDPDSVPLPPPRKKKTAAPRPQKQARKLVDPLAPRAEVAAETTSSIPQPRPKKADPPSVSQPKSEPSHASDRLSAENARLQSELADQKSRIDELERMLTEAESKASSEQDWQIEQLNQRPRDIMLI